ncbi:alpha-ketoglutarate-dependent dioxygenase AlkB [Haloferula sp. BvORR071]|uniref:alpha-ketoglutarate-dependent dioxygenase AlkB family protein n=1 Tax=Haloferula sp. BvORR071 TaxID=1396141 RepID=UPI000554A8C8|nr:alpha-ketoglutarate-dependent dioxygenase AlkB [Haloferula sp. BvORR071]
MDLFHASGTNLLPCDGTVIYYGRIFPEEEASRYFSSLMDGVPWKNDEVVIFGKRIVTARKVAWYGDAGCDYTYSGTTKQALPWNTKLLELKSAAERISGESFNSCLLNLYHDGSESMGWHSDDEKEIARDSAIASLSFGAKRRFAFRHKETKEKVELTLENGSLLVMKGETQRHWQHQLPKAAKITTPRINLTFRKMVR